MTPKTKKFTVTVDARMIGHSGIGVTLRGLFKSWAHSPPPFNLRILGFPNRLDSMLPNELVGERIPYKANIYGLSPLLSQPSAPSDGVFFSPHYAAPIRARGKLVVMVHDLIHISHPTRLGTSLYMRACLANLRRRAAYTITTSRHTKVQLQTLYGFTAHRTLTYPLGPGLAGFVTPDSDIPNPCPEKSGYLLAVGLFKPHKNWDFLIHELSKLWKTSELKIPLVAAGMDQKGRDAIRRLAAKNGVADRVIVAPRFTDSQVAAAIQGARALIFPSLVEGFGLPILEAMRLGTPVVAADLSPMNEVGGDGLIKFDPDKANTFHRAVLQSVVEASDRDEIVARGKANAELYSWTQFAEGVTKTLQRAHRGD